MNETDIDNEDFVLRLALKMRLKLIQKWPIFINRHAHNYKPHHRYHHKDLRIHADNPH